jgi:hypothetical protein
MCISTYSRVFDYCQVRLTSFRYLPNGSVGECLKPKTYVNRLLHLINMFSFELFILFFRKEVLRKVFKLRRNYLILFPIKIRKFTLFSEFSTRMVSFKCFIPGDEKEVIIKEHNSTSKGVFSLYSDQSRPLWYCNA